MKHYNSLAPFPVFDTEYVEFIENRIMQIENEEKYDYDQEPVVSCKYCNNLSIKTDEDDNDICLRCGAVNELREFKNIFEYLEYIQKSKQ